MRYDTRRRREPRTSTHTSLGRKAACHLVQSDMSVPARLANGMLCFGGHRHQKFNHLLSPSTPNVSRPRLTAVKVALDSSQDVSKAWNRWNVLENIRSTAVLARPASLNDIPPLLISYAVERGKHVVGKKTLDFFIFHSLIRFLAE